VNFRTEEVSPTFSDYSAELRARVPQLFVPPGEKGGRVVITEFGRAIDAKTGWFASGIEYVKQTATPGKKVALIHGGSDLFPRECYAANDFEKRVSALSRGGANSRSSGGGAAAPASAGGQAASSPSSPGSKLERADPLLFWQTDAPEASSQEVPAPASEATGHAEQAGALPSLIGSCGIGLPAKAAQPTGENVAAAIVYDIAGPLCFGGDKLRKNISFPKELLEGDFIGIHDAGATPRSLFSRHCSRSSPAVYAYSVKKPASSDLPAGEVELNLVRPAETTSAVLSFW
jgi:hypothetical protein